MAIYSCNLSSVGRTTHAAGTAGAHLRYVSREGAEPVVEANVIPLDPVQARTWMDREEQVSRINARLVDKVRVAIPRELSRDERQALVRDFVRDLTQDRVPWLFAIHQDGHDTNNPHAHIVLHDRDLQTGKRLLRLSDSARDRERAGLVPKAVEWIRERWEHHANAALERAGHDTRIDRRTLDSQGIEREATIHLGPRAQHIEEHVHRAESKKRENALGREIDYPSIDHGRTRKERHAEILDLNLERASRSPNIETRLRAKFEREQGRLDRRLECELAASARSRTREERALKKDFRSRSNALRSQRLTEYNRVSTAQRDAMRQRARSMRLLQRYERGRLKQKQSSIWSRLHRAVDWTGAARRKHLAQRRVQIAQHKNERHDLVAESRETRRILREAMAGRFEPRENELAGQRRLALAALKEMHSRGEAQADAGRQLRAAARESERVKLEEAIRLAKHLTRERRAGGPPAPLALPSEAEREHTPRAFDAALRSATTEPAFEIRRMQWKEKDGPSLTR